VGQLALPSLISRWGGRYCGADCPGVEHERRARGSGTTLKPYGRSAEYPTESGQTAPLVPPPGASASRRAWMPLPRLAAFSIGKPRRRLALHDQPFSGFTCGSSSDDASAGCGWSTAEVSASGDGLPIHGLSYDPAQKPRYSRHQVRFNVGTRATLAGVGPGVRTPEMPQLS